MPKLNVATIEGKVTEVSGHQFLPDGAEVLTIVIEWYDDNYRQEAAMGFYAKKGLDRLTKLDIKVGDTVKVPYQPHSSIKQGTSTKGDYRFWQNQFRADGWNVEVIERGAPTEEPIPFPGSANP